MYPYAAVYFRPARKSDRITGWTKMRRLLADAGKPDVPGLYISRACEYFWSTVPYLARDMKRVEDVDSTGPDHAADAVRYGILRRDDRLKRNGSGFALRVRTPTVWLPVPQYCVKDISSHRQTTASRTFPQSAWR